MHVVVCRVAGDDQPYVRYVQDRRVVGVGVPGVDGDQRMAFRLERRPVQQIGDRIAIVDLAREPGLPERPDYLGRGPLAHPLDDCRRCDGADAWEALADRAQARTSGHRARG